MHVRCDFLCCGREYPGLCACRLFFRLLTLLFSGCFYYLYGTVVPGPGKFGVSLPRCSRAPYSGIAPPPRLGEGGCRVDGILSLPDCHTPDPD